MEVDYRATRMLTAVASQRQGLGAMQAAEMGGSDDHEVSFTGLVLDDDDMAANQKIYHLLHTAIFMI